VILGVLYDVALSNKTPCMHRSLAETGMLRRKLVPPNLVCGIDFFIRQWNKGSLTLRLSLESPSSG